MEHLISKNAAENFILILQRVIKDMAEQAELDLSTSSVYMNFGGGIHNISVDQFVNDTIRIKE